MPKHNNLVFLCASCGEPMKSMGEWPIAYPKTREMIENVQKRPTGTRYICGTCKVPHPDVKEGTPVGIAILEV